MNHFMGPRGCEGRKEVEALGNPGNELSEHFGGS